MLSACEYMQTYIGIHIFSKTHTKNFKRISNFYCFGKVQWKGRSIFVSIFSQIHQERELTPGIDCEVVFSTAL